MDDMTFFSKSKLHCAVDINSKYCAGPVYVLNIAI